MRTCPPLHIERCPENPIVRPGMYPWRRAVTFNPAALYDEGKFYLYERTAGTLRPFHCYIGMLESDDGVHFRHVSEEPVFTPAQAGSTHGSVQDPRVVRIEDRISYSEDLLTWTDPEVMVEPAFAWENNRIGGSTPPLRTDQGWLILYHGVETVDPEARQVVYRLGALLADLEDPTRIIARCPRFIMEPETYYEHVGLYIPHVIFPTGAVVVDGTVHIYYGCCDTAIGLATVPLDDLVQHVLETGAAAEVGPSDDDFREMVRRPEVGPASLPPETTTVTSHPRS